MQVSVESINNLERKMTVKVESEAIQSKVDKRLKSMVKTVKLNGFRPGKVPLSVVRKNYGKSIFQEVVSEVMQSSYGEALAQEKLNPAGSPTIEEFNPVEGEGLEYVANFEVYPQVKLAALDKSSFERLDVVITDADIDRTIEKLREQKKDWVAVDRKAKDGDQVTIDFTGKIDGAEFDGGKADDFPLTLGKGNMIPGFEDQLSGSKKGDELTLNVTFPDDYQQADLAAKAAEFATIVKKVEQAEMPDIDEAFIKSFGVESGKEEELREQIKSNLERERDRMVSRKHKDQAMELLLKTNEIDIPQALVRDEIAALKQQASQSMQGGSTDSMPDNMPDDLFEENARKRVTLGLLINEVISDNAIKADQAKVDKLLQELAADYHDPAAFINYYMENNEQMAQLEGTVLEDQVVDWIIEQTSSSTVESTFESLMDATPASSS